MVIAAVAIGAALIALVQGCDNQSAIRHESRDRARELSVFQNQLRAQVRPVIVPMGVRGRLVTQPMGATLFVRLRSASAATALNLRLSLNQVFVPVANGGSLKGSVALAALNAAAVAVPGISAPIRSRPVPVVSAGQSVTVSIPFTGLWWNVLRTLDFVVKSESALRSEYVLTATYTDVTGGSWSTVWRLDGLTGRALPHGVRLVSSYLKP